MLFVPLNDVLPELVENECRSISIRNSDGKMEQFALWELYCTDPDCDCCYARLIVINEHGNQLGCIIFGWENEDYYRGNWMYSSDFPLPGPLVDVMHRHQCTNPDLALELVKTTLKVPLSCGTSYAERLKQHYLAFRTKIIKEGLTFDLNQKQPTSERRGRNVSCSCGSGKKYKRCCQNAA